LSHDNYKQGDDDENNVNFRKYRYAYNEDDEKMMIMTRRAISSSNDPDDSDDCDTVIGQ
jgi:hypothetical protein